MRPWWRFAWSWKKREKNNMGKTILIASVGSLNQEAEEKTLLPLKLLLLKHYGDCCVNVAYTSPYILKKKKEQGQDAAGIEEALEDLSKDSQAKVVLLPTHLLPGKEYAILEKAAAAYKNRFNVLILARPLMEREKDINWFFTFLKKEIPLKKKEGLVLIGHGSPNCNMLSFGVWNDFLRSYEKEDGCFRMIGSLRGPVIFHDVLSALKEREIRHVVLMPFMALAGNHVIKDMCGNSSTAWESRLLKEGISVQAVPKGLLEYTQVAERYVGLLEESLGKVWIW